jgi:purine-nucleoside phosphorylase
MTGSVEARAARAAASIKGRVSGAPEIAVILGSGLGELAEQVEGTAVSYRDIEEFPRPTVEGHRGLLCVGRLDERSPLTAFLSGRFHYYEGWSPDDIVMPVLLSRELGCRTLIVTNAAGAVNRVFRPGDLVLIRDHINLTGMNPLIGQVPADWGPRFPDMTEVYARELRELAQAASDAPLMEGVYAAFSGPSYETPAEIRMAESLGADMVGMSTVPEAITASFLGMRVLGISCITNMAAGILDRPLSHQEVMETGKMVAERFGRLICSILLAM